MRPRLRGARYGEPMSARTVAIGRTFSFAASHKIDGLVPGHKCSRLHGHTYEVVVELAGQLDEVGFVVDFGELEWVAALIESTLDHQHLNDILDVNPTSENLALWFLDRVVGWADDEELAARVQDVRVTVKESPRTYATAARVLKI